MSKIAVMGMALCVLALAACFAGLWLLHLAINDGDTQGGAVAALMAVAGGAAFVVTMPAFRP